MPVHQFVHDPTCVERGPVATTGATTRSASSPRTTATRRTARAASRCRSSRRWSRRCTRPASRSSSTSSTTTPPRATSSGPTLSFRGIDNAAYYRLVDDDPAALLRHHRHRQQPAMRHPHVLQLIMDSLRYWVTEMHVDGFRFDLAATLARQFHEVDRLSAFFDLVQQDPVVSQVKLIAEPWDVGDGGYQVGNFPPLWTEWNGKYRDTVRDFWRGEPATLGEFASRLTGSSRPLRARRPPPDRVDQLRHRPRRLHAARPGVLQREAQRGQRRGQQRRREPQPVVELRRRGRRPTTAEILALRARQQRNFLATLLLSPGRADDRCTATSSAAPSSGNNNVYCQDNEISWVDWDARRRRRGPARVHPAAGRSCAREHPVFRRRRFFAGHAEPRRRERLGDIAWFQPDGAHDGRARTGATATPSALMVFLNGDAHPRAATPAASRSIDDSFLLLFNGQRRATVEFVLPDASSTASTGRSRLDTVDPDAGDDRADSRRAGGQRDRDVALGPGAARAGRSLRDGGPPAASRAGRCPIGDLPAPAARRTSASPRARRRCRYLRALGVSHAYLSPVLAGGARARPHGYDVVDHAPARRRSSAARPACARAGRRAARARASASSSTSCPTTWRCRRRSTLNARALVGAARRPDLAVRALVRRGLGARTGRLLMPVLGQRIGEVPGRRRARRRPRRRPGRRDGAALLRPRVPGAARHRGPAARPSCSTRSAYRLAHWRVGRRGAELPPVLRRRHPGRGCASRTRRCSTPPTRCCSSLVRDGVVDGLRIDHPDGLADPRGYLRRLAERDRRRLGRGREDPRARRGAAGRLALRGHHRLRRAAPRSAACSSTRPAVPVLDGRVRRARPASTRLGRRPSTGPGATCCAVRSYAEVRPAGRRSRTSLPGRRCGCATTRCAGCTEGVVELLVGVAGLPRVRRARRAGAGRGAWRSSTGRGRSAAEPPPGPRPPRSSCCATWRSARLGRERRARTSSASASSRPAGRRWPRASRTPPPTAGSRSSRSTRSAADPDALRRHRRPSCTPSPRAGCAHLARTR